MKKQILPILLLGCLTAAFLLLSGFNGQEKGTSYARMKNSSDPLKKAAFEILDEKCNVCHRKKNPFMVFNSKNMSKRAPKIYQMVFVERKMPKGDDVRLTAEEYSKLEKWLFTQNIY